jgi:enoyl-CoA hydratase/carnithine racemase
MQYAYQTVTVDVRGAVHWLTLNRPESLNAITTQMATELSDYFGGLQRDRHCIEKRPPVYKDA